MSSFQSRPREEEDSSPATSSSSSSATEKQSTPPPSGDSPRPSPVHSGLPPLPKHAFSSAPRNGPAPAPPGHTTHFAPPATPDTSVPEPPPSPSGLPNPNRLATPVRTGPKPSLMPGIYSSSGFDLIGVLQRVATRPNPTVDLGPVDGSCTFLVVDARKFDFPIVYASESFEQLTGYSSKEILGRNCRFLQAPNGHVTLGSRRNYTSNDAAHQLKVGIMAGRDVQVSMVNYKKTGEAFMNMITLIPITWDTDDIVYYVGFQVDVVEQPNAIMRRMKNGTYAVNYSWMGMPSYGPAASYLGNDGLFHPSTSIPTPATPSSPSSSPSSSSIPTPATPSSSSSHLSKRQKEREQRDPSTQRGRQSGSEASASQTPTGSFSSALQIHQPRVRIQGVSDPFPATADIYSLLNINHPSVIRNGEYVARMWYALLLASTSDFIHVLSLKGTFWYVGPGVTSLLGYEPHELIDTRLAVEPDSEEDESSAGSSKCIHDPPLLPPLSTLDLRSAECDPPIPPDLFLTSSIPKWIRFMPSAGLCPSEEGAQGGKD